MTLEKPKVIGVIPARYASQRLPAKPLIDLLGKSMVQRVYEQAKKSRLLDLVVVATDDARIEDAVKRFGGSVLLTSPEIKNGSERVAVVASQMAGDIFVNIQGDEPLIAPEMIDQGVQLLLDDSSVPVGTLVKKVEVHADLMNPNVVKVVVDHHGNALYFSRSVIPFLRDEQETVRWLEKHTFYKHIGLYCFRKTFLMQYTQIPASALEHAEKLEQLRILEAGYTIRTGVTAYESIPIDTPEDVSRVETLLRQVSSHV